MSINKFYITVIIFSVILFLIAVYPHNTAVTCTEKFWITKSWIEELGEVKDIGYNPQNNGIIIREYIDTDFEYDYIDNEWKFVDEKRYVVRLYELCGHISVKRGTDNTPIFAKLKPKKDQRYKTKSIFKVGFDGIVKEYPFDFYREIKVNNVYKAKANVFFSHFFVSSDLADSEVTERFNF